MKAWEYRNFSFADRVKMHIVTDTVTGCHNFTGRKDNSGYGQIKDKGRGVLVHRWVLEQANGPIPPGMCALHTCDNPSCVNLAHLYVGTHTDNMRDKAQRGRSRNVPTGKAHKRPMAKLSETDARAIKVALMERRSQREIARLFGVHFATVSDISTGKTWKHIEVSANG